MSVVLAILGLGAWYAVFLLVTSCARGHWWRYDADMCWRCQRTGIRLARDGDNFKAQR